MEFVFRDSSNKTHKNDSYEDKTIILQKQNDLLTQKLEKTNKEIHELKRQNKLLTSKLNLLLNDMNIVKNVKIDMNDYSNICPNTNEDSLKEFFYLLLISEKMKYVNIDYIWMIDSNSLYNDVMSLDLPFYEWGQYLQQRLERDYKEYETKLKILSPNLSIISKIKTLWYEASLSFFNRIKSSGTNDNNKTYKMSFKNRLQNIIKCKEDIITESKLKNKSNTLSTHINDHQKEISLDHEEFEHFMNNSNVESECIENEINNMLNNPIH